MHRRPRWLRIGARIGKRIDVIQILHSARQRHLAGPLYLDRNGRLLSDRVFFSTIQRRQHTGLFRVARVLFLPSHSRSVTRLFFLFPSVSVLPDRTTALRERTNQFVVPPIYFHSSRRLQPTEKTNLALVPSFSNALSPPFTPALCSFFPVSLSSSSRSIRVYRLDDETEAHVNTLIAVNRYSLSLLRPLLIRSWVCFMRTGERKIEKERHTASDRGKLPIYFCLSDDGDSWRRKKCRYFVSAAFRALPSIDRFEVCIWKLGY